MMTHVELKAKVLTILTHHVGRERAIGMGELYSRATGEPWTHRINHTRALRKAITELRYEGALIGETRAQSGGGYYLARTVGELTDYFERRTHEALKKLRMVSVMKRCSMEELLGQMLLNLKGPEAGGQRTQEGGPGHDDAATYCAPA